MEVVADLLETVIAASLGNGGCSLSEVRISLFRDARQIGIDRHR